jgi:hypothetical protein
MACELSPRQGQSAGGQGGEAGTQVTVPEPPACEDDFDCTAAPNGYCVKHFGFLQGIAPFCLYSCTIDADCDAGMLCACIPDLLLSVADDSAVAVGECVAAQCKVDSDCNGGALCVAPTSGDCGPQAPSDFHCQSPDDECSGPSDCPAGNHRNCRSSRCDTLICGRPFLVDGAIRQSELVLSRAWLDADCASAPAPELDDETRRVVAEHWARAGLMEHASIAAFARFSLQLLALGAPPELVRAATAAMADETRHAELCFGLASRYALHGVGPAPLDVSRSLGAVELLDVVDLVVEEGCIGETAAALEAAWAAEAATDGHVRDVLRGIADDEARHAELAYAFVAWAARQDPRVRARVEARLEAERAACCGALASETADDGEHARALAGHGVLSDSVRREARAGALLEILPSLVDLLDSPANAGRPALAIA